MYPVLFKFGSFNVYSYGVMLSIGYALAMFIIIREAKKEGLDANAVFDMMLMQLIVGIIGSRFLFLAEYAPEKMNVGYFISFEQGGLTFYGSVIFSFVFDLLYLKLRKIPFWKAMDCVGLGIPVGIMVARIGCFLNGCCYGIQCSESIGFRFRHAGEGYFHATQLYESFAALIVFIALWQIKKRRINYGEIFLCSLGLYGLFRFFIEFLRAENPVFMFGMTLSQVISILIIIFVVITRKNLHKRPDMRIFPNTNIVNLK